MIYNKISGFSDEIDSNIDIQFAVINKLGIKNKSDALYIFSDNSGLKSIQALILLVLFDDQINMFW